MKRLVNASNIFVLVIVRAKDDGKTKAFKLYSPKLKYELVMIILTMMKCFKNHKDYLQGERYNMRFICRNMHIFLTLAWIDNICLRMNK